MRSIALNLGDRSYVIDIGNDLDVGAITRNALPKTRELMIVTNTTIAPLHLAKVQMALEQAEFNCHVCVLKDGEQYKDVDSYMQIMSELLSANLGRDCALVALGGGVVGDMTGFAAATYQRGVDFVQIPTTLLAMVDSSVGGKTAINHPLGKNMIGAFYQPRAVIADLKFLETLPVREMAAGMAEVIKYGLILDQGFTDYLAQHSYSDIDLEYVAHRCCELKAQVVQGDEREKGQRALLNFGHTFGHAIEVGMGFGTYLHGEAVAIGMSIASYASIPKEQLDRVVSLLKSYDLPVEIPAQLSAQDFIAHMHHDKKVKQGKINYILLEAIGSAYIESGLDDSRVAEIIDSYQKLLL